MGMLTFVFGICFSVASGLLLHPAGNDLYPIARLLPVTKVLFGFSLAGGAIFFIFLSALETFREMHSKK